MAKFKIAVRSKTILVVPPLPANNNHRIAKQGICLRGKNSLRRPSLAWSNIYLSCPSSTTPTHGRVLVLPGDITCQTWLHGWCLCQRLLVSFGAESVTFTRGRDRPSKLWSKRFNWAMSWKETAFFTAISKPNLLAWCLSTSHCLKELRAPSIAARLQLTAHYAATAVPGVLDPRAQMYVLFPLPT